MDSRTLVRRLSAALALVAVPAALALAPTASYASHRAPVPTALSTDGKGCATTLPATWLTTPTPRLTATPHASGDVLSIDAEFQVADGSGGVLRTWTVPAGSGVPVTVLIPPATIPADGGPYSWRVRTAGTGPHGWSASCLFQVDTAPPAAPTGTVLTADPVQGQPVDVRLDGPADAAAFAYGLLGSATDTAVATGGSATITIVPGLWPDQVLSVWTRDAAGNLSQRFDMRFSARAPGETGSWPLAGNGFDAVGGHDLALPPGASYVPGPAGEPGGAYLADGTACATTGFGWGHPQLTSNPQARFRRS